MTLTAFFTVATLLTLGAISPGPAVLMSARTGVTEGLRTGFFLAMGIGLGAVFWALLAMSGLALLFQLRRINPIHADTLALYHHRIPIMYPGRAFRTWQHPHRYHQIDNEEHSS